MFVTTPDKTNDPSKNKTRALTIKSVKSPNKQWLAANKILNASKSLSPEKILSLSSSCHILWSKEIPILIASHLEKLFKGLWKWFRFTQFNVKNVSERKKRLVLFLIFSFSVDFASASNDDDGATTLRRTTFRRAPPTPDPSLSSCRKLNRYQY